KNFDNGTDCTVVDEDGHDVNDDEDDITVAVTSRPKGAASRKVRFSLHSNGHFVLRGLPTGSTKVVATRTRAGSTTVGRKRLKIQPNVARSVRVMRRPAHGAPRAWSGRGGPCVAAQGPRAFLRGLRAGDAGAMTRPWRACTISPSRPSMARSVPSATTRGRLRWS